MKRLILSTVLLVGAPGAYRVQQLEGAKPGKPSAGHPQIFGENGQVYNVPNVH